MVQTKARALVLGHSCLGFIHFF